jgi:hypothetical protein
MLRILHCLDNRLKDGDKVVSPTHRPRSTSQKYFTCSGTHFCQRLSKPQVLVRLEGLGKFKKFVSLIVSRTHDLSTFTIVPEELPILKGTTLANFNNS